MRTGAAIVTDRQPADLGPESEEHLGGKALNLLRLRASGFPVPRFVVVTSEAFREVVASDAEVESLSARLAGASLAEIEEHSAELQQRVRAIGCPLGLLRDVRRALQELGEPGPWAVRSSAPGEDAAQHSFAGLLDSFLNVKEPDLAEAIARVWASVFSTRCLAYRLRKGLGFQKLSTAVVIQEMVDASSSGVLFSEEPGSHAEAPEGRRMLVVAGFGLGEGVVQGSVATDSYRVGRAHEAIERSLSEKTDARTPAEALDDAQVYRLRDLALAVEQRLGGPVDLEWAFDEGRSLRLLQARPIVRGPAPSAGDQGVEDERRIWDNANIVESYPGLTLPLTFSFVRGAYERAFRGAARHFFPLVNPLAREPQLFASLVGLVEGRVYYNLLNWYAMHAWFARPERHRESWDRLIGIRAAGPATPAAPGVRARVIRMQAGLSAIVILLRSGSLGRRFQRRFQAFLERHRDAGREPTALALAARYRRVDEDASTFWYLTLFNDLCALRYQEWLTALCRLWAPEDADLAARLLAASEDVLSVAPLRSLLEIAAAVRGCPSWLSLLENPDDAAVWRAIQQEAGLAALRSALLAHVERFGDRALAELKLESPTFREHPALLLPLLRGYVAQGLTPESLDAGRRARLDQAEAALRRVRGPLRRLVLRLVRSRSRGALATREAMRLGRGRLFGIVRGIVRALGQRFVEQGALDAVEDVFSLTLEEVLSYVEGTAVSHDLRALVVLRGREYAALARHEPGPRVTTRGIPSLDRATPIVRPVGERRREGSGSLLGVGCSSGRAEGPARVVLDPAVAVEPGGVLVARSTDPAWAFLMMSAAGLVAERGSALSHTAIVARELGIPAVVGVPGATLQIPLGALVRLDGGTGEVDWGWRREARAE